VKAHGKAPQSQHRAQATGRTGVHGRRDGACLAKRHDVSGNLIRIWVRKYEEGTFDDEAQAADMIQEYEARVAALERLVGKQALELEFPKGDVSSAPRPRSGTTSVIVGPAGRMRPTSNALA
jgi:transposase